MAFYSAIVVDQRFPQLYWRLVSIEGTVALLTVKQSNYKTSMMLTQLLLESTLVVKMVVISG